MTAQHKGGQPIEVRTLIELARIRTAVWAGVGMLVVVAVILLAK